LKKTLRAGNFGMRREGRGGGPGGYLTREVMGGKGTGVQWGREREDTI